MGSNGVEQRCHVGVALRHAESIGQGVHARGVEVAQAQHLGTRVAPAFELELREVPRADHRDALGQTVNEERAPV
ncbi:MAG: hypothetical protein OEY03_02135 [Rhizobacter sp.]|nr:hypothetical protein [Rhizobacter sp.]